MRVALRKHHNSNARVAALDIPTYCGAIRITGVGDVFSDALGRAVKIASQITDDPIIRAIMPPQAVIAIDAVRDIAGASRMGPDALREVLNTYSGPTQQALIATLAKEQGATAGAKGAKGARGASADNMYRGVGPAPSRGVGAPMPGQSSRGSSVSVTQSNPQGGRVTPTGANSGTTRDGAGNSTVDQRTSSPPGFVPGKGWTDARYEQAYYDSLKNWGKGAADRLTANVDQTQAATDAEVWHPGDYIPPPAPGKLVSSTYQAQLDAEAQDPGNPYTMSDEYADYYAQQYPDMFGDGAQGGYGYDPYNGGAYAYPDNGYGGDEFAGTQADMAYRWEHEQAAAAQLDEQVEERGW